MADYSTTGRQPSASLNAATGTGAGSVIDFITPVVTATLQTVVTGAPVTVSCTLEGSNNATNWITLATSTSTTGDAQYSVDKPFRFLRANLGTLTGGTAPTVTAWIAGIQA